MNRNHLQLPDFGGWLNSLALRVTLVLSLLGALSVGSYLLLNGAVAERASSSAEINFAGRQRMLSQRIALLATALSAGGAPAERERRWQKMQEATDAMQEAHRGLVEGSRRLGLAPPATDELRQLYFGPARQVDRDVRGYLALARTFLDQRLTGTVQGGEAASGALLAAASGGLIDDLDAVTRQYQLEGERGAAWLMRLQAFSVAVTLGLLLLVGVGVFRPLLVRIRSEAAQAKQAYGLRLEAERWSRMLLDSVDEGMVSFDAHGVVTLINPAAARMLGEAPAEGATIQALFGSAELQREAMQAAAASAAGGPPAGRRGSAQVAGDDGRSLWVEYSANPVARDHGGAGGVLVFRDITDRRTDEERIRKLSAAVEQAPVAVMITDLNARIEYVNPEFERVTGYAAAEVLGRNPRLLASGRTSRERYQEMWSTVLDGGTWQGEFTNRRKDGTLFQESVTIAPVRDGRGAITHLIAVKLDVTQARLASARSRAIRELQSAFIAEAIPRDLFRHALQNALELTESRLGFIGEVSNDANGAPCLRVHEVEGPGSTPEETEFRRRFEADGLEFRKGRSLVGAALASAAPLISNDPRSDTRAAGMPAGHPPLAAFMAIPFLSRGRMVGMLGLANRPGGYREADAVFLEPFAASCAQVIEAAAAARALKDSEERLRMSQAVGHVGTWDWNIDRGSVNWSEEVFRILGVDAAAAKPGYEQLLALVHPEDQDQVKAAIAAAMVEFRPFNLEHRIVRPGGEVRVINQTGEVYRAGGGGPVRMLCNMRDVTEREQAHAALAQSQDFNRAVVAGALVGIVTATSEGKIVAFNPAAEEMFRCSRAHALGRDFADVMLPEAFRDHHRAGLRRYRESGEGRGFGQRMEISAQRSDGKEFPAELAIVAHQDRGLVTAFVRDLSVQKQAEEALRGAQKLEAVGRLTGGIAHDFNNILGIVMGNLDIARRMLPQESRARPRLDAALNGAKRGATLTRRLLGFSRRQARNSEVTEVSGFIANLKELIARSVTARISVVTDLAPDLWPAAVDPGDLEDAILNLAINARDAMPQGGVLTIRAGNVRIDKRHVLMTPEAKEGDHLAIEVSDTGVGMAPAMMERVFEPFFTTKDKDRGTGLGLAMVYGFVKRSGGHITVNSQVGAGSTFQIFLPRATEKAGHEEAPAPVPEEQLPPGAETLLVVDDEEALLDAADHQLRELGYRTLTARNGAEALGIIAERHDIDLLFSDVIMPGCLDGYGLAREARRLRPELKILLTSGFTGAREATRHAEDPFERQLTRGLLAKPYTTEKLASAIRGALVSAVPRAAAGGRG